MKQTITLIALSMLALPVSAQKRGRVVDAQGQPVAFANVVALNPADSAVVAATLTRDDGQWQFADSVKTLSLLRVSAVGYESLYYKSSVPMEQLTLTLRLLDARQLGEASVVCINVPCRNLRMVLLSLQSTTPYSPRQARPRICCSKCQA